MSITNVLFIKGFCTDIREIKEDIYYIFDVYFMYSNFNLDYFSYKTTDDVDTVYTNLVRKIHTNKYDILIGNSMGCCFLLKYCKLNNTLHYKRIIFITPFFQEIKLCSFLSHIPLAYHIQLPKFLIIPNNILVDWGNILNDKIYLLSIKQLLQLHSQYYFLPENELINFINSMPNVVIFYASHEKCTIINKNILHKFNNTITVKGNHGLFLEHNKAVPFFKLLTKYLN